MILDDITVSGLAHILTPYMKRPAWPGLDDSKVRMRAVRYAKQYGLWTRLGRHLTPQQIIPAVKRSDFREFRRTGDRKRGEEALFRLVRQMQAEAFGLWLGHPKADLDRLQDLLWALCETTWWVVAAHEDCAVDLFSTEIAMQAAEVLFLFNDVFEEEVKARVGSEIERRVLDPAHDWRRPDWWQTAPMNWNHVCNANLITTALYRIRDARQLAAYIHPLFRRMEYAIQGFAEDGGCLEGPGYWEFGFGHFLNSAVALAHRTGGKVNLMKGENIERICRYPLASYIAGKVRATFADSGQGWFQAGNMLKINRFFQMPELYGIVARHADGTLSLDDNSWSWRSLCLYRGEKAKDLEDKRDYLLPKLGQVKLRAGRSVLMARAGNNGVPHNHNDIGSFIFYTKGRCMLTDPGAPQYTAKTFGPRRYEILFCRSRGHSVPVINSREQPAGSQYHGTLSVEGLNEGGAKKAAVDMTKAYADPTLRRLIREFRLSPNGVLSLVDQYEFRRKPRFMEEAFITYEPARAVRRGRAVLIGRSRRAGILRAVDTPGRFTVARLVEESKEGRGGVVTRIAFAPRNMAKTMCLVFEVS